MLHLERKDDGSKRVQYERDSRQPEPARHSGLGQRQPSGKLHKNRRALFRYDLMIIESVFIKFNTIVNCKFQAKYIII